MCVCLLDVESISVSRNITFSVARSLHGSELQPRQNLGTFPLLGLKGFTVVFKEDASS